MKRWTTLVGLACLGLGFSWSTADAAPFSKDPVEAVKDKVEKDLSEKEKALQERLDKFEEDQAKNLARVVVLQWNGSDVTYENELLQRNIKARTTRSNALFVPEVDLYQQGRREPDRTLRPLDQRASVPDSTIDTVLAAVATIQAVPWDGISEQDWGQKAAELKSLSNEIWFIDREALREPLFLLYSQIGRAAENANNSSPPFYEEVGGVPVNYYYYLAAALAVSTPDLMSKLHNSDLIGAIGGLKSQLEQGRFATLSLNFEHSGRFDARKFITQYKVFIDGVAVEINNEQALYEVPAGRADVYLERSDDGHGLSVRVEEVRVDSEEVYSVREQARKRMGLDFQKQLMKNKNQCLPEVDDDVLTYVAIYQKLHPGQEIYIAVPEGGSVNRIHLWKWIEEKGQLVKIDNDANAFPVRFVALLGTGLHVGGASLKDPLEKAAELEADPPIDGEVLDQIDPTSLIEIKASGLPIAYELRGHWDRLMVGVGMTFSANLQKDGWIEIPQTGTGEHRVYEAPNDSTAYIAGFEDDGSGTAYRTDRILLQQSDVADEAGVTAYHPYTKGNAGEDNNGYGGRRFQRGVYLQIGGVLGREAGAGFGPRFAVRTGWTNAPHAVDLTGHAGWSVAVKPKKKRKASSRIQMLVDTDLFGGVMLPYGDTLRLLTNRTSEGPALDPSGREVWGRIDKDTGNLAVYPNDPNQAAPRLKKIGAPIPHFGFEIKAGVTF